MEVFIKDIIKKDVIMVKGSFMRKVVNFIQEILKMAKNLELVCYLAIRSIIINKQKNYYKIFTMESLVMMREEAMEYKLTIKIKIVAIKDIFIRIYLMGRELLAIITNKESKMILI
jgi:hypothetical protein